MPHFDALQIYSCGKHCEKRRNMFVTSNFSFFSQCFLPYMALIFIPPKTLLGGYIGVGLSVDLSVHWSVCTFLSALFLINYWTNFIQTSQVNSVSSRDVHMKCWLWFIELWSFHEISCPLFFSSTIGQIWFKLHK